MKKRNLFFLVAFLLSSCAPTVTAILTPTLQPTETLTPSPTATKTPSPTPTITPTPTQIGGGAGKFIFEYYKVAYEKEFPDLKGERHVFISNWDGTDLTPITSRLNNVNHIESISAGGQRVLVSSRSSNLVKGDLYLIHLNSPGSDPIKLAGGVEAISRWPQANFLDNTHIVYIGRGRDGYGFYTANIDGTDPKKIGAPTGKAWGIASSDKSRIYWYAFTNERFKDSFGNLYAYGDTVSLWWTNIDGSGQGKLESNGHQIFPTGVFPTGIGEGVAFSPDGTSIAWIPGDLEQDCSGVLGTFWTPAIRNGTYTMQLERPSLFLNKNSPYFGKVVDIPYVEDYVRRCNILHVATLSNLDNDTKIPLIPPFSPTRDDFLYHKDYVLRWWPDSSKILLYEDGYVTWDESGRSPFAIYEIAPKDRSPSLVLTKVLSHSLVVKPSPDAGPRFTESFGSFKFSPDGRQILFTKYSYGRQASIIKVLDLETMNYIDDFSHNITPDFQAERVRNIYWLPSSEKAQLPTHAQPLPMATTSDVIDFGVSTPIVSPTPTPPMPINEDFEGSNLPGIEIISGEVNWQIVDDGTGNHVFQNDNSGQSGWPGFSIGSSISNGIIEYRVRLLHYNLSTDNGSGRAILFFRKGENGGYIFSFHPFTKGSQLSYVGIDDIWSPPLTGGMSTILFQTDVWYTVRVELQGSSIAIYLDDKPLTSVVDDRFAQGNVSFGIGPDTYAQFDDISLVYHLP